MKSLQDQNMLLESSSRLLPSVESKRKVKRRRRIVSAVSIISRRQGAAMPNDNNSLPPLSSNAAKHKQQLAVKHNISVLKKPRGRSTSSTRIQQQQQQRHVRWSTLFVVAMLGLLVSRQQVAASTETTTTLDRQAAAARHGWFGPLPLVNRKLEEEDENDEENIQDDQQQQEEEDDEEEDQEEEEEDQEEDQDDEEEEEQEDDDKNEKEEENSGDNQIEQDDFFEDALADDVVVSDYGERHWRYDDDFYAFVGDPAPPSLLPLQGRYIIGYIVACLGLMLGASGGIGGGGIAVPVYLIVMGLSPKAAMGVGSVTILGGTLASTSLNVHRRHPLADRPLIDWDLILVMQPVVLIGVFLGTFIHQILSEQVLVVSLVILLSLTAQATLSKAMRMYRAENRYIRHLKAAQMEPPNGTPSRTFTFGDVMIDESSTKEIDSVDGSRAAEQYHENLQERWFKDEEKQRILIENPDFVTLRSDLMEQEKFTPASKIAVLVSIIIVLTVLNVAIGGGSYQSPFGIECGSASFWMMHVVMIGFLILSTWAAQTYLIARHEIKNMVRFKYVKGDIRWNNSAGWLYPVFFMMAGLFAGMFGIGGGIVIVPLLLHLGTHPAVASSTSSAMVLMTSIVSSSTYYIFGLILIDFATVGFVCGLIASYIGAKVMVRARRARSASGRRFDRNSYIAFVIGGVVLVSAILMTIQYVLSIVEGGEDGVRQLCDVRF